MAIIWSQEPMMQAKNDDDLCEGERSAEVKMVNYAPWLPNVVRRIADVSFG